MKIIFYSFIIFLLVGLFSCFLKNDKKNSELNTVTQDTSKIEITEPTKDLYIDFKKNEIEKKVDVIVDGKLFTTLKWDEKNFKPVLHPIKTATGKTITRGFPLTPKPGERADHMHHVGNWFNYGNVNGIDFWGNGHTGEKIENGGEIILTGIDTIIPGLNKAVLVTKAKWVEANRNELLNEKTEYHFIVNGKTRIIDRIVSLTALEKDITFKDTKEGLFAIRVASELELPVGERTTIVGRNLKLKKSSMKNRSGQYKSSDGIFGKNVWGTRAKWMALFGEIENEKLTIAICDHPENPNFPTYWHAREYGLLAANPFGVKDFINNDRELNYKIHANQTITFKYRILISSNNHLADYELNNYTLSFAQKY